MDREAIRQQVTREHESLKHVVDALQTILDWPTGENYARKLSSLRFGAESFQRHLSRLLALEEFDGYMDVVLEERPNLQPEIAALRGEHDDFRRTLHRIVSRLDWMSAEDRTAFDTACEQLAALLRKLDEHHRKEAALLQKALLQDEGGQGG